MKRRFLSIVLSLAMVLSMLPDFTLTAVALDNAPWQGSGTEENPYKISSADDLWALSRISNSGTDLTGIYFMQTQNIDLETNEVNPWIPVSTTYDSVSHQFTGTYDGGQYSILNMVVNKQSDDDGFFGYIGKGGVLRHINVIDGYVSGTYWAGGIAGRNYGTIEYCSFSGTG